MWAPLDVWSLGDILTSIVSNSHFWKRSEAWDMTICGFQFLLNVTIYVFAYWWNFQNLAPRPSPGVFFGLLVLPCEWEIIILMQLCWLELWQLYLRCLSVQGVSGCPWLSVAPLSQLKRISNVCQTHLKRTSNAPQTRLKHMSKAPQTHLNPWLYPK